MASANAVDTREAAQLLAEAADRNQSLDFIRLLEDRADASRTRFVHLSDGRLAVEVPSRRGHVVPVRPGEVVEAYFRLGMQRYWFATTVAERSETTLSGGVEVPVLILNPPREVQVRQRRRRYRVRIVPPEVLPARLWRLEAPGEESAAVALPQMEVLDLSAGGLRLLCSGEACAAVEPGETVRVALPLESDQPPVVLDATVCRVSRGSPEATHMAIEFADLESTPEGRAADQKLSRFVAARQREEARRARKVRT